MAVKIVRLKLIETTKDLIDLGLPAPVFTMVERDGGRVREIVFDTDDEAKVMAAMDIIKQYMPLYRQVEIETKTKKQFKKDMGIRGE